MTEHIRSPYGFRVKSPSAGCEVKDIDTKQGIVVGYFAAFNSIDSDGDYIVPGAFRKTIAEWGPGGIGRIAHLIDHNMTRRIGKLLKLEEDSYGLRFESQLSKNTYGRDALIEYEEGILREHSFGFDVIAERPDEGRRANALTELRMYEGSGVTWGANMHTPVVDVKGMIEDPLLIDHLIEQMKAIKRTLQREITDARAIELETRFTSIEHVISAITKALTGPQGITPRTHEPQTKEQAMLMLIQSITQN